MSGYSSYSEDDFYEDDGEDDEEEMTEEMLLIPCSQCGRKFVEDSLERHEKICAKLKSRKTFDSRKQRLGAMSGTGKSIPALSTTNKNSEQKIMKKKADWRANHRDFIKTIRMARGVTAALKSGAELPPPPTPTINPNYIQCPLCERRFNETAAERHIKFCKEQKARLPKQPSDLKYDMKKEKQDKRCQYRPPLPGKKKSLDSSPVKARSANHTSSNASPGSKTINSPIIGRRDKTYSSPSNGQRKESIGKKPKNEVEERPLNNNSRYVKNSGSRQPTTPNSSVKEKPRKNRGEPKWFEDLKKSDPKISKKDPQKDYHVPDGEERGIRSGRRKLANFCHDCGTKYPVVAAKFCCECGVRRMSVM